MSETNKNWKEYEIPDVMSFEKISSVYEPIGKKGCNGKNNKKAVRQQNHTAQYSVHKKAKSNDLGTIFTILSSSAVIMFVLLMFVILKTRIYDMSFASLPADDKTVPVFSQAEQYIKIDSGSFTILAGESFRLKCTSYPEDILQDAVWSSNNDDVIVVDSTGMVSARKAGIAAIMVKADGVSDVVAVEVKNSMSDYGSLNLDYYADNDTDVNDYNGSDLGEDGSFNGYNGQLSGNMTIVENDGVMGNNPGNTQMPDDISSAEGSAASVGINTSTGANTSSGNNYADWMNTSSDIKGSGTNNSNEYTASGDSASSGSIVSSDGNGAELSNNISGAGNTYGNDVTTGYQNQILEILQTSELTQYLQNTYMYEKDNVYCGEVLVEKDAMHIYIKKEDRNFLEAVKPAIETILPGKASYVLEKYASMSENKTIWVSGKKVTYIMAEENAHAHIIIYYDNAG